MFSSFMVNTWITATVVAVAAGVVGFFVVLRGASFAAHALPLGAFPGAAAANLLGIDPFIGLFAFCGLGVLGIHQLGRRGQRDVTTALSLVMLLGLGALFLSLTQEYAQEVFALLFGEVLGIGGEQVMPVVLACSVSVLAILVAFRPLLLSSVAPDLAAARGLSANVMELVFLTVLALATAVALPVVGALMVFSLMIGPATAARGLARNPVQGLLLSVALAVVTVWSAIALSYVTDWPVGFFVGTSTAVLYGLERGWRRLRRIDPVGPLKQPERTS